MESNTKIKEESSFTQKQNEERAIALKLERNGERYLENFEYKEAFNLLNRASSIFKKVRDKEGLGRTSFRIGQCHEGQQKYKEAIKMYEESKEYFESLNDIEHYCSAADKVAKCYYWQGMPLDAIKEYEKLIEKNRANGEIYNNIAFLQIEISKLEEAKKSLYKAIELREKEENSELHICYNNLGIIDFLQGKYQEASEKFAKGIESDKREPQEDRSVQYIIFANPQYKNETFEKSRVFFDSFTKAGLKANLASSLSMIGKNDEALNEINEALSLDKDGPYIKEAAGWIYLKNGNDKKALDYFKGALPIDSNNEDIKKVINLINPYINSKIGRNDPCPCGSGKKYKKCHGSPI